MADPMSSVQTTVIIPVRNGERFVREALDSVLAQLGEGDEVIVVDDASTDGTLACVQGIDPRVRVLFAAGRGPSAARNLGIAAMRGEFVAFLDHDDLWPPDRHRQLLGALLGNPSANAAVGRVRMRVEADGQLGRYARMDGQVGIHVLPSCLYRRGLIERARGFSEDLRHGEDVDFHLRLVEAGAEFAYCDADALVYRRHGGNVTNAVPPDAPQMLEILARKLARGRNRSEQGG